jgi:hypothetical protein
MMHFPSGTTFTPYTVLRNVSSSAVTATPMFWWMVDGSPHSSQLSPVSLLPHQSRKLDLPALLATAGLTDFSGSIQLSFQVQGNTGSLLMAGGSVDQSNTYVFEVTPHGISESASKSLSYWDTANGDDTMVTIWNPAGQAQDLVFQITYAGGHYNYPVHLATGATRTFNFSEVVDSRIPDPEGNVIPEGVREGGAKLMGSSADNEQILVAMDAGTYNVRKATCNVYCQTCDGVTGFSMSPSSFSVAADGQTQLTFYETWNTGAQYDDTSYATSWTTSNGGVATVGTNGSGTAGLVAGVSGGSVTISAQHLYSVPAYTSYWCEGSPWSCPYTYYSNGQAGASGTVADLTPVISSLSPNTWWAGVATTVTIAGQHFGTNTPTLQFSPSSAFSYSVSSHSDTQIIASISVAVGTPSESVAVSVTSTGYNGNGFQSGGTGQSATSTQTTATVYPPTPNNLQLTSATDEGDGFLHMSFTWGSTTGRVSDLVSCQVRENVTYPTSGNLPCVSPNVGQMCYWPPSPPWPPTSQSGTQYVNPTLVSGPATAGGVMDSNTITNENFVKPYSQSSFPATQNFQYSCSGGAWTTFGSTYTITRQVTQQSSAWVFKISKTGISFSSILTLP